MASYEQQPDLQSYSNLRPYELPYNQIMQTVQAKTSYWLQGANQLKSAQQQATGLDLSLDQNRSALSQFNQQANQQINQAAKSDLSIGDNVNQALNIYAPLYNGQTEMSQNIMGDHALTTRAKQIQQQFEESKTKNNGKEYSPVNEQYALQSYQNFVRSGDPKGWKDAYQNLKGYTPYYDYHKEITDNLRNCKPSSVSQTGVNGMYLTTNSASGLTSSQVAGCVGSNLSGQAEQQMQIEGVVKYGHNYQALADDYFPSANASRQYLATQRAAIAAQLTKATPANQAQLKSQLQTFDSQIANIDDSIDRYHKGDLSFFKNNYDTLASATYRNQKLQALGNAFAYTEQSQKIAPDAVQMMIANHKNQERMLQERLSFEGQKFKMEMNEKGLERQDKWALEAAKLNRKLVRNPDGTYSLSGMFSDPTPYTPSVDGSAVKTGSQDTFNADLNANLQAQQGNRQWMYQYLKSNPRYAELVPDIKKDPAAFDAFAQGVSKDELPMQDYVQKQQQLNWRYANLQATKQAVETSPVAIANKQGISNFVNGINQGTSAILQSTDGKEHIPLTLSPQDLQSLVQGNATHGIQLTHQTVYRGGIGGVTTPAAVDVLQINGKTYNLPPALQTLLSQRDTRVSNYQQTLDNLYSQNYVNQGNWIDLSQENDNDKNPNGLRRMIGSALAPVIGHGDNSVNAVKDIQLQGSDFAGKVRFSVKGDSKGNLPSDKQVIQQMAAVGMPNVMAVPNTTGVYEVSGVGTVSGVNYNQPNVGTTREIQQFVNRLVDIHQRGGSNSPRTALPSYNGINIAAINSPSGQIIFELSNPSTGTVNHVTDPAQLVSFLGQLSQSQRH